jgi:hypothetical protein
MQDTELTALMDAAMRLAFPPGCGGVSIRNVELVLLDADIYGSHDAESYENWKRAPEYYGG